MKPYKFLISGGGTGGHIYPAIAIANELKLRHPESNILFVGAKDRMEMEKVPEAGYAIEGLWISGIQRRLSLKNALFPIKLTLSLLKARSIIKRFKPDVVIGTGGYASAPLLKVAAKMGIPCLIQEQNSHAGLTNKWLANQSMKICVAYEGMEAFFPSEKIVITGNPVRQDLLAVATKRAEAITFFGLDTNKKTLLVLGGSLGAKKINELIEKSLPLFIQREIQLVWQCGSFYKEIYKNKGTALIQVHPYLNRMDLAYAAADVIVSRAGAISVSELCLVGKPVVFIPSPNVAEDHQTKNALAISRKNAALVINEADADASFEGEMIALLASDEMQRTLANNIAKLGKPNATKEIAFEIEKLLPQAI